jgi:hypothetical protein
MRRAPRNLWMTLWAASSLWKTASAKAGHSLPEFAEAYARAWAGVSPEKVKHGNLILWVATGWHVMGIKPTTSPSRFLLAGGPFHCVRMGVERTAR